MICQQWAAVISSISRLFSVKISEQCSPTWCGLLQSEVYDTYVKCPSAESVDENADVNFAVKEFQGEKQYIIW
jgi:hypothetical protein